MPTPTYTKKINDILDKLKTINKQKLRPKDFKCHSNLNLTLELDIASTMLFYYNKAARKYHIFSQFPFQIPASIVSLALLVDFPDLHTLLVTGRIYPKITRKEIRELKVKLNSMTYTPIDTSYSNELQKEDIILIVLKDNNDTLKVNYMYGYNTLDEEVIDFMAEAHPGFAVLHIAR